VLAAIWLATQISSLFSPGLLDDVDSIYIECARQMLLRHDFVTPFVNGIRFFDKPPLMYWLAAGSMKIFGMHDWAARLPLALMALALTLAVYALGSRFFGERGGFFSALVISTSIGPFLYTRFFIPDVPLALWMTLAVYLFVCATDELHHAADHPDSARRYCYAFAVVLAFSVLTKGLIGLIFPLSVVLLYLACTRQLRTLWKLYPITSALVFVIVAVPWHILAALRNPAIAMPAGVPGLPARGGWAWFYLYNEHVLRFLGRRFPHDYGQVPLWLFWVLLGVWLFPWVVFLPTAVRESFLDLRKQASVENVYPAGSAHFLSSWLIAGRRRQSALILLLWSAVILGFFTFSSRQEYYSLPALPALALMVGGLLAREKSGEPSVRRRLLRANLWFLLPLSLLIAVPCAFFAIQAPTPPAGADIASLLSSNPGLYNLSLGHVMDITGRALGLFRLPLVVMAASTAIAGLYTWLLRRREHVYTANLLLAVCMCGVLWSVHDGLRIFYPAIGSKQLALDIRHVAQPRDISSSTANTRAHPA